MNYCVEVLASASAHEDLIDCALILIENLALSDFLGLDEGSVEDPSAKEFDVGEASRNRDWVGQSTQDHRLGFYFGSLASAETFYKEICERNQVSAKLKTLQDADWNEKWRSSFQGLDLPPHWSIRPTWSEMPVPSENKKILLDPSFGFGFGNHPTTQMCLKWIGEKLSFQNFRALDFGSGSGILSVASVLSGAKEVLGIEIDDPARDASRSCFELNNLSKKIRVEKTFDPTEGKFDLVVANIISSVLLANQKSLLDALNTNAVLILSGVLSTENEDLDASFRKNLEARAFQVLEADRTELEGWKSYFYRVSKV